MLNWKACFVIAVSAFIGAIMLPYEYTFLTTNAPLNEPPEVKQGFEFTTFMLYLIGGCFTVAGIIEFARRDNSP